MIILRSKLFSKKKKDTAPGMMVDYNPKYLEQLRKEYKDDAAKTEEEIEELKNEIGRHHAKKLIGKTTVAWGAGTAGVIGMDRLIRKHPEIIMNKKGDPSAGKAFLLTAIPGAVAIAKMAADKHDMKRSIKRETALVDKYAETARERDKNKRMVK